MIALLGTSGHIIRDGEREFEIRLEPDVTPATAFRILSAFHRGEWVDALHPQLVALGIPMPGPDYLDDRAGPLRLARAETEGGLPEADVFELVVPSSGSRWSISRLRVSDDSVALLYIGMAVD